MPIKIKLCKLYRTELYPHIIKNIIRPKLKLEILKLRIKIHLFIATEIIVLIKIFEKIRKIVNKFRNAPFHNHHVIINRKVLSKFVVKKI